MTFRLHLRRFYHQHNLPLTTINDTFHTMDDGSMKRKMKSTDLPQNEDNHAAASLANDRKTNTPPQNLDHNTDKMPDSTLSQKIESLELSKPEGKNATANRVKKERAKRKKEEEKQKEMEAAKKIAKIIETHSADTAKITNSPFEIKAASGKRLGMFATRDIKSGTKMFKETPVI
jgi:hypothetical protein